MQNNQIPPQRMFQPQVAYPIMSNIAPSAKTQGVFSTYSARLKHSNDNALLLPESYLTKKTRFTGDESDEEFDDMMEESEEEDEEDEGEKIAPVEKARPVSLPGSAVAPPPTIDYPKKIRKKNHLFYSFPDLIHISDIDEILVPIRLDIDVDSIKLRDRFLWNMNGTTWTQMEFNYL